MTKQIQTTEEQKGLVQKIAERYGVDSQKFFDTLKSTAFKQSNGQPPSNEQMMTLLVVADQYQLNPFTKEIYAFPDRQNGIVPVVGVDGWSRIINTHKHFDGIEFRYSEELMQIDEHHKPCHAWIECVAYRKDRQRPTVVREYLDETYKPPMKKNGTSGPYFIKGPWQTHTKRFLRHKALIQCARIAFGYVGIYDQDEADNILSDPQEIEVNGEVVSSSNLDGRDVPLVEHSELDPMLSGLIERASSEGTWNAAKDWVTDRFKDKATHQRYALHRIDEAQKQVVADSLLTNESGSVDESLPGVVVDMPVIDTASAVINGDSNQTTYF